MSHMTKKSALPFEKNMKKHKKSRTGGRERNNIPSLCQVPYTMVFLAHFGDVFWWLWRHIGYRDGYLSVLLLDFGVEGHYLGHNIIMAAQAVPEKF
jgi:hypothetical protein